MFKSSLTRGHFKAGLDSVLSAKLRSFWTMLGIIIGVASVITIISIGEGVRQQVSGQIHHMGKDLITVQPEPLHPGGEGESGSASLLNDRGIGALLTTKDVSTVANAKGVAASAPLTVVTGTVRGEHGNYNDGFVIGTGSDLSSLLNQSVSYGSFLTDDDEGAKAAVLGHHAAKQMFDQDVPLGRSFNFRGERFLVRGIFNNFSGTPVNQLADFNKAIFIPVNVAHEMTNNGAPTYEILAKPTDPNKTEEVADNIRQSLDKTHGGDSNLRVVEGNQNLSSNNNIVGLLTRLVAGIAAISLFVGGLGIMNVMWVSVAERTREIGIRKAVGATNRQILSQFMVEATILSFGGGLLGIALAYLINLSILIATNFKPVIQWEAVALAAGVSFLVGVVFGTIPALKAARRDAIDALRSE